MSVAMLEPVFDRSPAVLDQGTHFLEDSWRVLRVEMIRPASRVGSHLLRRIAHDGAEVFADESAAEIAGSFIGINDSGACREEML